MTKHWSETLEANIQAIWDLVAQIDAEITATRSIHPARRLLVMNELLDQKAELEDLITKKVNEYNRTVNHVVRAHRE